MAFLEKFYPKMYLNSILEISADVIKENNIKSLLLDIDNTLIDCNNIVVEGLEAWVAQLKEIGVKFCIVSNTNNKNKASKIAENLNIPYVYFATKPFKRGFKKAKQILGEDNNIAVVGDQILTDIWGANRCNMFSILVKPMKNKDIFITRFNRIIEKKILKRYEKDKKDTERK